jgi:hypothetical protein
VDTLRTSALAVLDKVRALLASEPARMIGYGSALVVVAVVWVIGQVRPGLLPPVDFNSALAASFTALAFVTIVVENIRRFVYSPTTYVNDLTEESNRAHEEAHLEEEITRALQARQEQRDRQQATIVPVAPAPEPNPDRQN